MGRGQGQIGLAVIILTHPRGSVLHLLPTNPIFMAPKLIHSTVLRLRSKIQLIGFAPAFQDGANFDLGVVEQK